MSFLMLLTALLPHPVHETVAELEWNDRTKRLEVALRLDPLDEQWLKRRAERKVGDPNWAVEYLRRRFRIENTTDPTSDDRSGSAKYHWIGREDKQSHVWWYFEIEPKDHERPRWIEQRMLTERNENHVNRILVLGQVPRRAITLTIQRPRAPLDRSDDEQTRPSDADSGSDLDRG